MRFGIVALAAAAALLLVGCAPQPEATPAPSATALPFATDEEAFAAAEATYRAYVDALNQVDLQDPETFEAVYAWTTGELNARDRENLSQMHSDEQIVSGASAVLLVAGSDADRGAWTSLSVCTDVSAVNVRDRDGRSLVAPDRVPVQALRVLISPSDHSPTGFVVSDLQGRSDGPECG